MDEQERMRLTKVYSEMCDEEIVSILLEDEELYHREHYASYELLQEEGKRRGLDKVIADHKRQVAEEEKEHSFPKKFVEVYAGTQIEIGMAKGLLEQNNIEVFVKGGILGTLSAPHAVLDTSGTIKLVVNKEDAEKAKSIIDGYLNGSEQ